MANWIYQHAGISFSDPRAAIRPTIRYWLRSCVGFNNCITLNKSTCLAPLREESPAQTAIYDLMVVVPDSTPVALRDSGRAYKAIWRLGVATDVLVWTHSDFEDRLPLKASLPSTIAREGKLLYTA